MPYTLCLNDHCPVFFATWLPGHKQCRYFQALLLRNTIWLDINVFNDLIRQRLDHNSTEKRKPLGHGFRHLTKVHATQTHTVLLEVYDYEQEYSKTNP
jgi:hypothetical protein